MLCSLIQSAYIDQISAGRGTGAKFEAKANHKVLIPKAGPIAERSNLLVCGRGDPSLNPREGNVFLRMAN